MILLFTCMYNLYKIQVNNKAIIYEKINIVDNFIKIILYVCRKFVVASVLKIPLEALIKDIKIKTIRKKKNKIINNLEKRT